MRTILVNIFTLCYLLAPQLLVAGGETTELVLQNNSGFMQDVSTELRQELPMCDEFLAVKWIREMPGGYWVGRVVVDVTTDGKTEQRELVVLEDQRKRRHGRFKLIDITDMNYRGNKFDELIMSADGVSGRYVTAGSDIIERGVTVVMKGECVMTALGISGSQSYLERGVSSSFTQQSDKKICITHPDKKKWLFKKK